MTTLNGSSRKKQKKEEELCSQISPMVIVKEHFKKEKFDLNYKLMVTVVVVTVVLVTVVVVTVVWS